MQLTGGSGWLPTHQNAGGGLRVACSKETSQECIAESCSKQSPAYREVKSYKQTTKLSSSLGLSPSNSVLPHSITDQLQKTKGYGNKNDLLRIFVVISAESGTGSFQLNIELRL